jgi:hypothetical protein
LWTGSRRPAHANFAAESICMFADSVPNEIATNHRSQQGAEYAVPSTR